MGRNVKKHESLTEGWAGKQARLRADSLQGRPGPLPGLCLAYPATASGASSSCVPLSHDALDQVSGYCTVPLYGLLWLPALKLILPGLQSLALQQEAIKSLTQFEAMLLFPFLLLVLLGL